MHCQTWYVLFRRTGQLSSYNIRPSCITLIPSLSLSPTLLPVNSKTNLSIEVKGKKSAMNVIDVKQKTNESCVL